MLNLYRALLEESNHKPDFEDERLFSNLYLTSLSYSFRSLATGTKLNENARKQREQDNQWLKEHSKHIEDIAVINLDALKMLIDPARKSCDAFFFNAGFHNHKMHLLGEFKNTGKTTMLKYMDSDDMDGLKSKVTSSIDLLRNRISFSGLEEDEEGLQGDLHLFLVYGGKNDTVSNIDLKKQMPRRTPIPRGDNRKQKHASRQPRLNSPSEKEMNEKYARFSRFLEGKGISACTREEFPGNALPKPSIIQGEKKRFFSMFSSIDFARIVDEGYFDQWKWGIFCDDAENRKKHIVSLPESS